MPRRVFINLPVTDLAHALPFYEALGAVRNPAFSNETTACMVFSDTIHAMLMTRDRFAEFTPRTIPDAHVSAQVLLCLSVDTREAVDAVVTAATAAGGTADPGPSQDLGFMYGRSIADPDGHIWEFVWMDLAALPPS